MDTWNWMHVMKTVVWAISRFINLHVDWSFILIVVITVLSATATLKAFLLASRTMIDFTSENNIFKAFECTECTYDDNMFSMDLLHTYFLLQLP